mmetsp:Transcript_72351/g.159799  ORF Transcript_72351/g.159799 Transcript_72351/m.159799 type:complete len:230 (-) Transcript_72351:102-791(-)
MPLCFCRGSCHWHPVAADWHSKPWKEASDQLLLCPVGLACTCMGSKNEVFLGATVGHLFGRYHWLPGGRALGRPGVLTGLQRPWCGLRRLGCLRGLDSRHPGSTGRVMAQQGLEQDTFCVGYQHFGRACGCECSLRDFHVCASSDPLRWSTSSTSGGSTRGLGSMVPGLGFHGSAKRLLGSLDRDSPELPSASLRSKHFNKHEEVSLQYHKWSNDSAVMCSQLGWIWMA